MMVRKKSVRLLYLLLVWALLLSGCTVTVKDQPDTDRQADSAQEIPSTEDADTSAGLPYRIVNNNKPEFSEKEITDRSFESYSDLDELGRCGPALACVGTDLMPVEKRGNISSVKPTGWHSVRYDNVDGGSLYNRCHLIGYQLSGENANEKNLITGTRYMNVDGMLPFEDEVADYVRETGNHVMYRVTPVFENDNLVASGVQMEALSVEDNGRGVSFHVFVSNIQPGIVIDYATGESREEEKQADSEEEKSTYVLNTNTKKFHLPSCSSVDSIKKENREDYTGSRSVLLEEGYEPCGSCSP